MQQKPFSSIVILLLAALQLGSLVPVVAATAGQETESLLEVNERRFQAMTSRDLPQLETILHEDLVYTHSNGIVESRAEALASLASGRFVYEQIVAQDLHPVVTDDTGVLTGGARIRVAVDGKTLTASMRFTAVYVRSDQRSPWRLIAWQSTRVD